jgi:hypothetical protein
MARNPFDFAAEGIEAADSYGYRCMFRVEHAGGVILYHYVGVDLVELGDESKAGESLCDECASLPAPPACREDAGQPEAAKRFTLNLDVDDVKRHLLVGALSRAPGKAVDQMIVPLARIAAAIKAGGPIDVDISDCDEYQRGSTAAVLSNVRAEVGEVARPAADRLYVEWVEQTVPVRFTEPPPRPLSEVERSVLLHGEKPL